jgi:NNP family nitrate/nitrite transporter-like MFS transporter
MHNLSHAKGDLAGSLAATTEPHFWVLSLLYIGTFGSFIGFSGVFPKLIKDVFPAFSTVSLGVAAVSLSFLGPLVGSLARPYGGRLADRFGGAIVTVWAFLAMAALALTVVATLPMANFWLFLGLFLALFVASGLGNGSTYRMIPTIYRLKAHRSADGGFAIPQVLSAAKTGTGTYNAAFYGFVAFYLVATAITWACYLRRGAGHAERI